jgi:hypothetical protein
LLAAGDGFKSTGGGLSRGRAGGSAVRAADTHDRTWPSGRARDGVWFLRAWRQSLRLEKSGVGRAIHHVSLVRSRFLLTFARSPPNKCMSRCHAQITHFLPRLVPLVRCPYLPLLMSRREGFLALLLLLLLQFVISFGALPGAFLSLTTPLAQLTTCLVACCCLALPCGGSALAHIPDLGRKQWLKKVPVLTEFDSG